MPENVTSLDDWVIQPGQHPSRIKSPVYMSYNAVEDLDEYHPLRLGPGRYELFLDGDTDENGKEYAKLHLHTSEWHTKLKYVADQLKLYPMDDGHGNEILLDKTIARADVVFTGGWRIVEWQCAKYYNLKTGGIDTQELIRWRSANKEAISSYRWPVYGSVPTSQEAIEHAGATININFGQTSRY